MLPSLELASAPRMPPEFWEFWIAVMALFIHAAVVPAAVLPLKSDA